MNIYSSISTLKGVGPKVEEKFNKISVFNILDLLLYFPRDYEYINSDVEFEEIDFNQKQMLEVTTVSFRSDIRTKTGKTITTIQFDFRGHIVFGKWFNQPYIKKNYKIGQSYCLIGKFKKLTNGSIEVINPIIGCNNAKESEIIPKYPLKGDITEKAISRLINYVLDNIIINENLPSEIVNRYKLISLDEAIRQIHFPKERTLLNKAIDRLKFQELFTYALKLLIIKKRNKSNNSGISIPWNDDLRKFKEKLPFCLTNAQTKAVREILLDQKSNSCMNRLVQGDVGSGAIRFV